MIWTWVVWMFYSHDCLVWLQDMDVSGVNVLHTCMTALWVFVIWTGVVWMFYSHDCLVWLQDMDRSGVNVLLTWLPCVTSWYRHEWCEWSTHMTALCDFMILSGVVWMFYSNGCLVWLQDMDMSGVNDLLTWLSCRSSWYGQEWCECSTHITALWVFMMLALGPKLQFGLTPYMDLACLEIQRNSESTIININIWTWHTHVQTYTHEHTSTCTPACAHTNSHLSTDLSHH